jgi:hypothetical protein
MLIAGETTISSSTAVSRQAVGRNSRRIRRRSRCGSDPSAAAASFRRAELPHGVAATGSVHRAHSAARSRRSPTTRSCPTARRPRWSRRAARRVAVPAADGLAERVRRDPRPRRRLFRLGPAGVNVPAARRYLPGTMVLETSWGTGSGWIIVRDVLLIGPGTTRTSARTHIAARRPTTTPTTCCCARPLRQRRGRDRWTASRCSTTAGQAGALVLHRRRLHEASRLARHRPELRLDRPTCGSASRARAPARAPDEGGRAPRSARSTGRARAARRTSTRPTSGWSGPRTTGSTGSTAAPSPITPGAATCSAAR